MDKKFNFKEQPTKVKILYGVTVAILCVTAIVIGIVSAASKKDEVGGGEVLPPVNEAVPAAPAPDIHDRWTYNGFPFMAAVRAGSLKAEL